MRNIQLPFNVLPYILGLVAVIWMLCKHKKQFELYTKLNCVGFAVAGMTVGFLGAKILYILEAFPEVDSVLSLGGISSFGAIWLVPLIMPFIGKRFLLKPERTLDICAPCVSLMLCFMRIGCFFNGCCGGYPITVGRYSFTPPVQLLEVAWNIALTIWLLYNKNETKQSGMKYPLFMADYSFFRFFQEFLRNTDKKNLLSTGQWWAIITLLIGLSVLFTQMSIREKSKKVGQPRRKK